MKTPKPIEEMSDEEVYEELSTYRSLHARNLDKPEVARDMLNIMRTVFEMEDDEEEDI